MAKANITLPDGTSVNIEGTPTEIHGFLQQWREEHGPARRQTRGKPQRVQLVDLIGNLIDGGFFKKPRDLASVKSALEEMGRHYPVTTLSGTMLQQVRRRNLRRIRQQKRWMYTR